MARQKRKAIPATVRRAVLAPHRSAGTFTCHWCGFQEDRLARRCPDPYGCRCPHHIRFDVDHVVPVREGGTNDLSNLVLACHVCNRGRRNVGMKRGVRV